MVNRFRYKHNVVINVLPVLDSINTILPREALSTGFLIFEPLLQTQGFDHSIKNLLSGTFMWYYLFLILFSVKCLGDSSDVFGNGRTSSLVFGYLRQSSGIVGRLRKSSETVRNCRKMVENSLIH